MKKVFFILLIVTGCSTKNEFTTEPIIEKQMLPLFKDNALQVTIYCSSAVDGKMTGILVDEQGKSHEFSRDFSVSSSNATCDARKTVYPLGALDGWSIAYVGLTLSTTGIRRGECFARIELLSSANQTNPVCVFCADYLTSNSTISFPGTGIHSSLSGAGYTHTVTFPLSLGSNVVQVQNNRFWRIKTANVSITTSAVAGNRFCYFSIQGETVPTFINDPTYLTAGIHYWITFGEFGTNFVPQTDPGVAGLTYHTISLPSGLLMNPGDVAQVVYTNTDVGDVPHPGTIVVEEWIGEQ